MSIRGIRLSKRKAGRFEVSSWIHKRAEKIKKELRIVVQAETKGDNKFR